MNQFLPGDLVRITLGDQLGVVIEEQSGTGLYRVMLMGEGENNRIFRYTPAILRKVSDE